VVLHLKSSSPSDRFIHIPGPARLSLNFIGQRLFFVLLVSVFVLHCTVAGRALMQGSDFTSFAVQQQYLNHNTFSFLKQGLFFSSESQILPRSLGG
jgi:hypothetical protein